MTRGERRRRRNRKIKQRMKLAININHFQGDAKAGITLEDLGEPGYFANNDEANKWGQFGRAKKTKARHSHASYRHKGGYGKAIVYCPHDLRQVEDMKQQINEVDHD